MKLLIDPITTSPILVEFLRHFIVKPSKECCVPNNIVQLRANTVGKRGRDGLPTIYGSAKSKFALLYLQVVHETCLHLWNGSGMGRKEDSTRCMGAASGCRLQAAAVTKCTRVAGFSKAGHFIGVKDGIPCID